MAVCRRNSPFGASGILVLSALIFFLGFCCAGLCAVMLAPLVWKRASRLTQSRLESSLPLSLRDVSANRDELRAEFAIVQRRLEEKMDKARENEVAARAENGLQLEQIHTLTDTLADREQKISDLESLTAGASSNISTLEANLERVEHNLAEARSEIANLDSEVNRLTKVVVESDSEIDTQRVEIVALKTQADNLSDQLDEKMRAYEALEERFADARAARRTGAARIAALERSLQAKDREIARQAERLKQIETDHAATLVRLRKDAEKSGVKIRDLESRITVQSAESVRLGKRSTALEDDYAAAAAELARLEEQVQETERRAVMDIERAREAYEDERARRLALASELATLKGVDPIEEDDPDGVIFPTFPTTERPDTAPSNGSVAARTRGLISGRRTNNTGQEQRRPSTLASRLTSRVVKPSGDSLTENAPEQRKAVSGKPKSVYDRISRLHSELQAEAQLGRSAGATTPDQHSALQAASNGSANGDTPAFLSNEQNGRPDLLRGLSDSELQSRIRDLADRFSVFDPAAQRAVDQPDGDEQSTAQSTKQTADEKPPQPAEA